METTIVYWGYIEIMEKNMKTTIVYWGYIEIMEKKMETTIVYSHEGKAFRVSRVQVVSRLGFRV